MTHGPKHEHPMALTCPTCGGAVVQTSEGSLPDFTCHLAPRFTAAEMSEALLFQLHRAVETAFRMFNECAELARRLAKPRRSHGLPVAAEHWEATVREMSEAAEVLRGFVARRQTHSGGDDENRVEGG